MRTRDIRPAFFKNEQLAECQAHARLLFAGLWTLADREGRLEYRPKKIKAELFPYENIEIEILISELVSKRFLDVYVSSEDKDVQVIQIINFTKHQRIHPKEAHSELPANSKKPRKNTVQPRQGDSEPRLGYDEQVASCTIPSIPTSPTLPSSPTQRNKVKTLVADDWRPDEKIFVWLEKTYPFLTGQKFEDALEDYKTKCKKNGYKYLDHYSAFQDFLKSPYREWNKPREPNKPSASLPVATEYSLPYGVTNFK